MTATLTRSDSHRRPISLAITEGAQTREILLTLDDLRQISGLCAGYDLTSSAASQYYIETGELISVESPAARLEYLRGEIRAERISYGELSELQGLAEHIDPSDVELLEAASVPEHPLLDASSALDNLHQYIADHPHASAADQCEVLYSVLNETGRIVR